MSTLMFMAFVSRSAAQWQKKPKTSWRLSVMNIAWPCQQGTVPSHGEGCYTLELYLQISLANIQDLNGVSFFFNSISVCAIVTDNGWMLDYTMKILIINAKLINCN